MEAALIQQILNRLYTDTNYRENFLLGKEQFYAMYGITSAETIHFLNALPAEQLLFFSKSLDLKRFHTVKQLLPLTIKITGNRTKELFNTYSQQYMPVGIHKHHDDALHFLSFIEEDSKEELQKNLFMSEAVKYERILLENFLTKKKFRITFHKYHFGLLYRTFLDKQYVPERKNSLIVWRNSKIRKIFGY